MAEITRNNYLEVMPQIKELIKHALFVTFDAEYSGLHHPPEVSSTSLFDSGADRYKKMRGIVTYNTAPQVGLCIFRKDPDESKNIFYVDGYQAFVKEPFFGDFNSDKMALSLEYKCAKFLRKCNFDFNAFYERSIPCLNRDGIRRLNEYLETHPDFMQAKGRYFDKVYFPEHKDVYDEKDKENLVKRLKGFSELVDVIVEYQIPIVGHNMALDLLYFFRMFCADLPEDYERFKQLANELLPPIYDTKYMVVSCRKMLNHPAFKENTDKEKLNSSSLYTTYLNTSSIKDQFTSDIRLGHTCYHFQKSLQLGKEVDLEDEKNLLVHDPAFDACVTGCVFLNVSHISARIDKGFLKRNVPPSGLELFVNVQAWKDQIYIARATIITMCLRGDDPRPSRPQWIKISSPNAVDIDRLRPELAQFGPVDIEKTDEKTFKIAAAGGKSSKQMKKFLTDKGFTLEKEEIPWDRQRYKQLGYLQTDSIYDRNKVLG